MLAFSRDTIKRNSVHHYNRLVTFLGGGFGGWPRIVQTRSCDVVKTRGGSGWRLVAAPSVFLYYLFEVCDKIVSLLGQVVFLMNQTSILSS